jgi:hypothetical protein
MALTAFQGPVNSLIDGAVLYLLGKEKQFYGKVRTPGCIAWALVASFIGWCVDYFKDINLIIYSYSSGFVVLFLVVIIGLSRRKDLEDDSPAVLHPPVESVVPNKERWKRRRASETEAAAIVLPTPILGNKISSPLVFHRGVTSSARRNSMRRNSSLPDLLEGRRNSFPRRNSVDRDSMNPKLEEPVINHSSNDPNLRNGEQEHYFNAVAPLSNETITQSLPITSPTDTLDQRSKQSCSFRAICASYRTLCFYFTMLMLGAGISVVSNFLFLYLLEDLGATHTLLGLTVLTTILMEEFEA